MKKHSAVLQLAAAQDLLPAPTAADASAVPVLSGGVTDTFMKHLPQKLRENPQQTSFQFGSITPRQLASLILCVQGGPSTELP